MTAVLAVDLGKTGCRAVLWTGPDSPEHPVREVPGAPGLAESGGVDAAVAAVTAAAAFGDELASGLPSGRLDAVCVGAAGAAADPAAARSLAELLLDALPTDEVAVTSDAVTAHAGALGGGAGVVLAAGTGSVTVGIGEGGTFARVDGWGPWLGDEGSGAWIGRAGLRAALRSHDGRGPATALTGAAADRYGDLDRLPAAVGHSANPARLTATFAPWWLPRPPTVTRWRPRSCTTPPPRWPRRSSPRPAGSAARARCPSPSPAASPGSAPPDGPVRRPARRVGAAAAGDPRSRRSPARRAPAGPGFRRTARTPRHPRPPDADPAAVTGCAGPPDARRTGGTEHRPSPTDPLPR